MDEMTVVDYKIRSMARPTLGRHTIFLGNDRSGAIIGNFSSIAEGVYIHGSTNHAIVKDPELASSFDFGSEWGQVWPTSGISKGPVVIGSDVWIGENAKILTGVTIGDGAIIGAHSVIAKDVPPYAVVVGNPQVIKRYRYSQEIIDKLLKIRWWDLKDDIIKGILRQMLNVEDLIYLYDNNKDKFKPENYA